MHGLLRQEIELKNGEKYKGTLTNIDLWMNVTLKTVTGSSKDEKELWRTAEMYIRGNTIKYIKMPDSVIDKAEEERQMREQSRNKRRDGRNRGRNRGGKGRGGGGRRR